MNFDKKVAGLSIAMPPTRDKQARILITDDEGSIRTMLHALLGQDYECSEASSAEEALTLLNTKKFDLVLSDITMGGMSGLEMVPQILARLPDTVILMISGEQTIGSAIEAMHVGAFDYITKPFDLRHVEAAVKRALEYQSMRETKLQYENHLEELVEQRTAERDHLVYHDALTGLPNRILFTDRLTQSVAKAEHNGQLLAVLSIAIDRLKKVNETLGYKTGDEVLRAVAGRFLDFADNGNTLASWGSDEFALLVSFLNREDEAVEVVRRVQQALKAPFNIEEQELFVTASVGISLYPYDGDDAKTLLQHMGVALNRAKEQGGDNYQFYQADLNAHALKRLELETSLRRALERDEFLVYYQPQIDTDTERIVGMEALVRWEHPELGLVSPAEFIPLAEDTGLIVPLGLWVLHTACAQTRAWQKAGFDSLRLSVNFSPRQFQQPDLLEQIGRALRETGLDPRYLEMELTESSIMKDADSTIKTLRQLKEMGVHVSIDDFGTGYSSLSYLKRFPIDVLKIDRSFVRDSTTDPSDAAIVMAIITLAHSLNLKVIAEGVETEEQLRFLRQLRCDQLQGYLFGKPLSANAFQALLMEGLRSSDKREAIY